MTTEDITAQIDEQQKALNQRIQVVANQDLACISINDHLKTLNAMLEMAKALEEKTEKVGK